MDKWLQDFLQIYTANDTSGGRKIKTTLLGNDITDILTTSDATGGRSLKITSPEIETIINNEFKVAYFVEVNSNSGTITIPTGATILLDQFPAGIDALVSTLDMGQPTGVNPVTSGGVTVDVASFDALGNYTLTATPSSYPVALIFILKIKAIDWQNLSINNILEWERNNASTSGGVGYGVASGTDTYTVTISGVTSYNDGDAYLIRYLNGNTVASPTLNINGIGAVVLYRNNDGPCLGGDILADAEMLCVYDSSLAAFKCIGTSPNTLFAYVTNGESITISKGEPVYAFSGTGDRMVVKLANNTADATSAKTIGLVYSSSIGANQKGLIIIQGLLDGLSTLPTSTWTDGDTVYLGATAGAKTPIKPYAPNHLVYLGVVTTASNGAAGRMYVKVQNGYELEEIHDVDLVSVPPVNNDVLTYITGASNLWKPRSLTTLLGNNLIPVSKGETTQFTSSSTATDELAGSLLVKGGSVLANDFIRIWAEGTQTSSGNGKTNKFWINSTNSLSGATLLATGNTTAALEWSLSRTLAVRNLTTLVHRNASLNSTSEYGSVSSAIAITTVPTFANDVYFIVSVNRANGADTMTKEVFSIVITKNQP